MKLYHYTSLFHLPQILEDGYLDVTESNASMTEIHAAPDVVWLTNNPSPEKETSLDGGSFSKSQVRFEVNVSATRYRQWAKNHNISGRIVRALNSSGGGQASNWYVSERQIPKDEWTTIEIYLPEIEQWVRFYNKYDDPTQKIINEKYWEKSILKLKEVRKEIINSGGFVNANTCVQEKKAS